MRTVKVGNNAVVGGKELRRQGQLGSVGDQHLGLVLRGWRA